jgi:hypothetical protein
MLFPTNNTLVESSDHALVEIPKKRRKAIVEKKEINRFMKK